MKSLLAFLLALSLLWKFPLCRAVRCYRCLAATESPSDQASCRYFDGSERFVADCPHSTFCLKRVVALNMLNEVNVGDIVKRYCAPQILNGESVMVNKTWKPTDRIHEESYSETCDEVTQEMLSTKTILCSCRGDLCNHSAGPSVPSLTALGGTVLLLLLRRAN